MAAIKFIAIFIYILVLASNSLVLGQKVEDTTICKKCNCDATTKTIDCSNKELSTIFSDDDWKALNDTGFVVERLDLSHNSIHNVTQFPILPIKFLSLHDNLISSIVNFAFHNLAQLESLDLSRCGLSKKIIREPVFKGNYDETIYQPLKNLKWLNLSTNLFHTLDSEMFEHMVTLEWLDLHENPFKVIDTPTEQAISSLPHTIRYLDLSGTQIETLPEHIFHALDRTLEILNISDNSFHRVPEALMRAQGLKELHLDANQFSVLDNFTGFPMMKNLERLSVSYNTKLEYIDKGAFSNLSNLKVLEIVQNNHLKEIHVDAFSRINEDDATPKLWPPIEELYLHHNALAYIDENMLTGWESMKVIDVRGKNFSCDCKNNWLTKTLIPQLEAKQSTLVDDLVCAKPEPMAGRKLKDIADKNGSMRCLDKYGNHPERDAQILIGLLLGICIGIPLTLIVLIFYKRGCFGLVRTRGPADFSRAYYQRAGVYDDTMNHI